MRTFTDVWEDDGRFQGILDGRIYLITKERYAAEHLAIRRKETITVHSGGPDAAAATQFPPIEESEPIVTCDRKTGRVLDDFSQDPAPTRSAFETQVGGAHYKAMGDYQPWEVLRHWLTPEEYRGYMKGTAIAYLARERAKGGTQDIAKAAHTLDALVEVQP